LAGVIGEDEPGRHLIQLLTDEKIATASIRKTAQRPTTHKTRVCAITRQLHDHLEIEDQQQIVRVDDESRAPLDAESKSWLFDRLRAEISTYDAIIIEDYAKGLIDQELVTLVITEAKKHGKIVAIDPNPNNPFDWSGGTVLKPNRKEAFLTAGLPYSQDEEAVLKAAAVLQKRHAIRHLLITLGEAGMLLIEQGEKPYHTPTRAQEVFDVSGAGDTAIAAFTLALAAGATGIEAAEIANHAAGVVVGKLGTATLNLEELRGMFAKTEELS
jgi:rfaE bifunctional protein kinase chain/domain